MEEYELPAENFDLELTLTCGQTFCWHRTSGELYGEGADRFYSFRNGKPLIVEQEDGKLSVETELPEEQVREALGLEHDLEQVFSFFPEDKRLEKAREKLWGLRIVQDEFFPCLVSYLCSPQMRIPRIKKMHNEIAKEYGEKREVRGEELLRFPDPEELAKASEKDLRELGLGYRAEYVVRSTEMVLDGFDHLDLEKLDYLEAKNRLKQLYGVGDKVADCVLLFSKSFHEAYPLDTWALKAVERHYPDHHSDSYSETSENLRNYFGKYSGYAQEYIFHAARKGIIEV